MVGIKTSINKFQCTGSIADEERPGRPRVPPNTMQSVQDAINHTNIFCRPKDLLESMVFFKLLREDLPVTSC